MNANSLLAHVSGVVGALLLVASLPAGSYASGLRAKGAPSPSVSAVPRVPGPGAGGSNVGAGRRRYMVLSLKRKG
jgi:hypothetical protein